MQFTTPEVGGGLAIGAMLRRPVSFRGIDGAVMCNLARKDIGRALLLATFGVSLDCKHGIFMNVWRVMLLCEYVQVEHV